MAVRGYEFYLLVLKVSLKSERSERVRDTLIQHEKIRFVSPSGHVIKCSVYFIDTDEIPTKNITLF